MIVPAMRFWLSDRPAPPRAMRMLLRLLWPLAVGAALGEPPAPPDGPPRPPGAEMTDAAETTNVPPRDPFWPVGYQPARLVPGHLQVAPGVIATEEDWRLARRKLVVSSVFRAKDPATGGDRFVARVNGQVVEPGAIVSVKYRDFTFRFQVAKITLDGPVFEKAGKQEGPK